MEVAPDLKVPSTSTPIIPLSLASGAKANWGMKGDRGRWVVMATEEKHKAKCGDHRRGSVADGRRGSVADGRRGLVADGRSENSRTTATIDTE